MRQCQPDVFLAVLLQAIDPDVGKGLHVPVCAACLLGGPPRIHQELRVGGQNGTVSRLSGSHLSGRDRGSNRQQLLCFPSRACCRQHGGNRRIQRDSVFGVLSQGLQLSHKLFALLWCFRSKILRLQGRDLGRVIWRRRSAKCRRHGAE